MLWTCEIQGGQYMISKKSLRVFSHPWALLEHSLAEYEGVFTWENSHRREFHTGMTFWFRIAFTWWLLHVISCYFKVHFMLMKYTCRSKSQTVRVCYPFQSTGRPISHRNWWSFRVYMIPLRDFVPGWNSHPSTRTGVNSRLGDSCRHNIFQNVCRFYCQYVCRALSVENVCNETLRQVTTDRKTTCLRNKIVLLVGSHVV